MTQPLVDHSNDAARLAVLDRYGLLGTVDRPELTALAELAARVCGVSTAFISVITDDELRQLASAGVKPFNVPRTLSMCDAVLAEDEPLVSADLSEHPRFRDNEFVRAGRAVFYASYQLRTPSGVPFGSLCVHDDQERVIDDAQRRALRDLADRVVDVLELEVRNRELASTIDELERSNLQLNAFAGQVSHDLRNPLGALSGTLELLTELTEEDEPDVATMRELLSRAERSTGRMRVLIEEVLQFAALGGQLDRREVDVHRLVGDVCDDLASEIEGSIRLGDLDPVVADPVQLRIVVQNLLANAAKYRRPGQPPRIELTARSGHDTWRLEVVDHGTGVPEHEHEHIFEPLVRVGDSTDVTGSGMGLATCRRIVEAHDGTISATQTTGGGLTVRVDLPATPVTAVP